MESGWRAGRKRSKRTGVRPSGREALVVSVCSSLPPSPLLLIKDNLHARRCPSCPLPSTSCPRWEAARLSVGLGPDPFPAAHSRTPALRAGRVDKPLRDSRLLTRSPVLFPSFFSHHTQHHYVPSLPSQHDQAHPDPAPHPHAHPLPPPPPLPQRQRLSVLPRRLQDGQLRSVVRSLLSS